MAEKLLVAVSSQQITSGLALVNKIADPDIKKALNELFMMWKNSGPIKDYDSIIALLQEQHTKVQEEANDYASQLRSFNQARGELCEILAVPQDQLIAAVKKLKEHSDRLQSSDPDPTAMAALNQREAEITRRETAVDNRETTITSREAEISARENAITQRESAVSSQEAALVQRENALKVQEETIAQREKDLEDKLLRSEQDHEQIRQNFTAYQEALLAEEERLGNIEHELRARQFKLGQWEKSLRDSHQQQIDYHSLLTAAAARLNQSQSQQSSSY